MRPVVPAPASRAVGKTGCFTPRTLSRGGGSRLKSTGICGLGMVDRRWELRSQLRMSYVKDVKSKAARGHSVRTISKAVEGVGVCVDGAWLLESRGYETLGMTFSELTRLRTWQQIEGWNENLMAGLKGEKQVKHHQDIGWG